MTKKAAAKTIDPREWLKQKLGETDFADFEKGMRKAAEAIAKGKHKAQQTGVAGQMACDCWSICGYPNFAAQAGAWNGVFMRM